ncbi:MAG TPA: polysaccharide biosynthesis tyrosine autokinase [Gemmatimonadaceae bacterium]|nr:polysaccharide biosynthesis tyrosine autokinase [Gemmatimonadaceae bacterium]
MSDLLPSGTPYSSALTPGTAAGTPATRPPDDVEGGSESIDIKESLATLRRHLWLIAGITAAAIAFTAYRVSKQALEYQATAVIRLVDARRELAGNLDDNTGQGAMGGYWTDPITSQLQVLRSRAVAAAVVDSQALGLRVQSKGFPASVLRNVSLSSENNGDTVRLQFMPNGVSITAAGESMLAPYDTTVRAGGIVFAVHGHPANAQRGSLYTISRTAAIDMVLGGLSARQRDRTDVVDVSFTAQDPSVAREIVNTVVDVFQSQNAASAQQQSRRRRIFVEAQLHQTDSLLQVAQGRLSDYRTSKKVYGSSDAVVAAEQTGLLNLDVQRAQLVADRSTYQTLLKELAKDDSGPPRQKTLSALVASPGIADNPVVQAIYTQLVAYQAALDSTSVGKWGSSPSNPDVQRLHALVAGGQAQLGDAVGSQITSLDARVAALDELRQRSADALKTLPATQAGEARLMEQVASARNMADELRDEYQKARIAEAVEAGQVEIVDLATSPYAPIGTSRRTKLLTGVIVGLLLGTGAAFLVERLNTAIRRREEIESMLQIPGLAIIPQIASPNAVRRLKMGNMSLRLPTPRGNWGVGNGASNEESLVTVSDFRSSSAEAFRTLRTNLIFSQAVQSLRTIVITSPSPQDGKTTTAANLAVTFAQQGMRVLIVDCDLRRARLHKLFRAPREPGLTQLMLGHANQQQVIQSTMVDNLWFLPAGAHPPNPSELLGGAQMRATLEKLGREFDILILDTPPVHAAADALILGSQSDGVILVLRAGHTERQVALDAVQRLAAVGVRVVGAVLNDPDHKVPQYGGYYYYDYYDSVEA